MDPPGLDEGSNVENISEKKQTLQRILTEEIRETLGKYEQYILHQYEAFNNMTEQVKKDPNDAAKHMNDFKVIYEKDKGDLSLDVYYRGVMGTQSVFGRPLLKLYLDHCHGNREVMESWCSHVTHLVHIGLITHLAYTAVTEDDEVEVRKKWAGRLMDIQAQMQEALSHCQRI